MALTPDQALEFRPLTLPQQHLAGQIEKQIDETIRKGWSGMVIVCDVECKDQVVVFEVARRFTIAGWNVNLQYGPSKLDPKQLSMLVTFKLIPKWRRADSI